MIPKLFLSLVIKPHNFSSAKTEKIRSKISQHDVTGTPKQCVIIIVKKVYNFSVLQAQILSLTLSDVSQM